MFLVSVVTDCDCEVCLIESVHETGSVWYRYDRSAGLTSVFVKAHSNTDMLGLITKI